ncbi:hypothetical protein LAUMK4_01558 [Mycobacterium persicum]|uniref:Uncharacterized protein n=1 Tax=Mycobacterium persicum TaxID=1487726 RepID=A0AB38UQY9_9MYCO|nr:hypothetical protein LAUMK15_01923 [Mycobacterium persicum]VAZ82964.1 hypothetical protein LAUMK42_01776 [Mycobacterium persicum]VAZ90835.1 hypothetical protein LAUMK4_01558 [Mycobacterium persicum]
MGVQVSLKQEAFWKLTAADWPGTSAPLTIGGLNSSLNVLQSLRKILWRSGLYAVPNL